MKRYLILKLLAINLVVIGFVMVLVWIAIVKELIEAHKGTVDAQLQEGHLHICVELPHISHQKRRSRAS